ncbi:MAG: hypothetical protein QUS11_03350 [Candidatus Fermentibacter sp.]|nr:hypothetical protein [Candidatus Fermentibacter sp.]
MRTMILIVLCFAAMASAGGWITGDVSHGDPQWTNFCITVKVGSSIYDTQVGSLPGSYTTCELPVGDSYTVICCYYDDNGYRFKYGLVANAIKVKEGMYTTLDFCFPGNGITGNHVHMEDLNGPMSLNNTTWAGIKSLL